MPFWTYLMKGRAKAFGFKAQKDKVTLLMCGNAAGFMLKPGLIYKAANPRTLKKKNTALLPMFWMHNPKAWITKVLMECWFHQSFIPQVNQCLADVDMEFKVLLIIMDNAGGHPLDLYYKGVKLEFLPPNTTSLLQPMDQGVIRAFKALYTGNSLQHLVDAMDTLDAYNQAFTTMKKQDSSCQSQCSSHKKDPPKHSESPEVVPFESPKEVPPKLPESVLPEVPPEGEEVPSKEM
ncbi:tigger transposable element-derived protein 1-like [Macrobrachium nipponense]|uniref:tigger transposable element-derived protein 1-like n=1 Tax=Macrobrachium nipponense TaxID=159736 RepID=UPI0030C87343